MRSEGSVQIARAGEVISLAKGTHVVYRGEEDDTEVVFVSYAPRFDAPRQLSRVPTLEEARTVRPVARLVPSYSVPASALRKGA